MRKSYGQANSATRTSTNHQMILLPYRFGSSEIQTITQLNSWGSSDPNFGSDLGGNQPFSGEQMPTPVLFQQEGEELDHRLLDTPFNNIRGYQTHLGDPLRPLYHDASTWDSVNPFTFVDSFSDSYFRGIHEISFGGNDMDLGEIREMEGIPDLEVEFGDPGMADTLADDIVEVDEDLEECHCEADVVNEGPDVCWGQSGEDRSIGDSSSFGSHRLEVEEINKSKSADHEEECIEQKVGNSEDEGIHEAPSETDANAAFTLRTSSCGSWDLQEGLNEVYDAFTDIITHGANVSTMFEPCQFGTALSADFSLCKSSSAASSRGTLGLACGMFRRSVHRRTSSQNLLNETNMMPCSLSLTLEKLCVWENKLYKEVKVEDKLGQEFDKEHKKLKKLYDRGADSCMKDASHVALQRLTPRAKVAISVVEGIAARVHKIRDEELHPQLCDMIGRLHEMWSKLFEAHKKQANALTNAQASTGVTCSSSDLSLKAILLLEADITKLGNAFFDWVKSQRSLVDLMKNWLMKFLPNNASEPISPSAPAVLAICYRWCSVVETVSAVQVMHTVNNLSLILRLLHLKLREEQHQRFNMEYFSDYHEKQLKNACLKSGVEWEEYALFITQADNASANACIMGSRFYTVHTQYTALMPIRMKLREAYSKHSTVMEQLKDAVPNLIQQGFVPVLQALEAYSLEMCNAVEQVSNLN
ncbi:protein ALTERED PHOSPHATE STARVATION RESPONSE 1-like [Andrographis paniculata]|uniref:protein ALTERED PHOSPHATE STARVATION RESPONSE 1-like n=1 Tax=Andrographis paniculata TaxID=175694 RepID=UPI0021E920CC|nr:protein ALTERED PHOSPHATE STARVATION RESPONSE 1-like [Andrographis paniculata]XP_051141542.1 protein ALTERED PHOSPHATE STARVATION RESPONSE 1-like [Andrographis paniculata]